jgi:hypothetical protein
MAKIPTSTSEIFNLIVITVCKGLQFLFPYFFNVHIITIINIVKGTKIYSNKSKFSICSSLGLHNGD